MRVDIWRLAVALLVAGAAVVFVPGAAALERATADRADDIPGPQIHVLYVVPSDAPDRQLDTNGIIAASVSSWQSWLKAQTAGRGLRLDTYGGQLDVSFLRLSHTAAEVAANTDFLYSEVAANGFGLAAKNYPVYYDGSWSLCGSGRYATPTLFLQAVDSRTGIPCPSELGLSPPSFTDFSMLHEVVHSIGFVPICAPHSSPALHVGDSNEDLMWGNSPWGDLSQLHLDVGHDDYYLARIPNCPDLSGSRFLEGGGASLAVTVDNAGGASGQVVADGQPLPQTGFDCDGNTCTKYLDTWPIQTAELQAHDVAVADEFIGWSGACAGSDETCTVAVDKAASVTAHFRVRGPPRLGVATTGRGRVVSRPARISCPARCAATFPFESSVELVASAAHGWRFVRWNDPLEMCGRGPSCEMIVEDPETFHATFARRAIPISVSVAGAGWLTSDPRGLACSHGCSASFPYGTNVRLRARAAAGWRFVGWRGVCRGSRACSLHLTGSLATRRVHAVFVP